MKDWRKPYILLAHAAERVKDCPEAYAILRVLLRALLRGTMRVKMEV